MDYFPPKTFLKFGTVRRDTWRMGNFEITPVNDQYNNEFYYLNSCEDKNGLFQTCYYRSTPWQGEPRPGETSPKFETEVQAIRWLEKALLKLTKKKISDKNKELLVLIEKNKEFISEMENK